MDKHDEEGVDLIEVHSLDEIPDFKSEAEEAEWWSTHELNEELWRQHGRWAGERLMLALPGHKKKARQGRTASERAGPA